MRSIGSHGWFTLSKNVAFSLDGLEEGTFFASNQAKKRANLAGTRLMRHFM